MQEPKRIAPATLAVALLLVLASIGIVSTFDRTQAQGQSQRERARAALAQTSGELRVAGLRAPVEIIRDTWGVPHIYGKNQADLFFAQGFVVAQDRLWQLELWHRKAAGRLAEVFGAPFVERDRMARLLRYRGDWDAEWKSYSPDARQIAEAFTRGINAWITLIERGDAKLPIEFQLTGLKPTPWTPEVVVSRMAAYPMTGNASNEIVRAQAVHALGPERAAELFPTDPVRTARPEDGLSLEGIDDRVTAPLSAAAGEVAFSPETLGWLGITSERGTHLVNDPLASLGLQGDAAEGSNNWTISGAKTRSGKPILANDPHRALLLPSLRYVVHLVAPGWDVIGAGEPAIPGVSIGHNRRIAFGLTIFAADQQDIVVEPAGEALSVPVETRTEEIRVRGEDSPRAAQVKFTAHGPIVYEDSGRKRAYALRWAGSEPGTAGYLAGLAISRAQNWKEFRAALTRWKLPPENFVYADVDGNIGYQAAALVPNRKCDGLLPSRGDTNTCKWEGWLTLDDLPHAFNPGEKFYATANNNNLTPGEQRLIGFEWSPPNRADRIKEVLASGSGLAVQDSMRLQADVVSLPARDLKPPIAQMPRGEGRYAEALKLLQSWDGRMEKDSPAAAIFAVWLTKLRERVYRPVVPESAWRFSSRMISLPAMIRGLREAAPALFAGGEASPDASADRTARAQAARDRALVQALQDTVSDLEKRSGPEVGAWRWGALHTVEFAHALEPRRAEGPRSEPLFSRGPAERPGDGNTVNATGGAALRQTNGASYRQVLDTANWDNSFAVNTPGQSGQPESPHYDDLLQLWQRDEYFPLVYSRAAVEKNAKAKLMLLPK